MWVIWIYFYLSYTGVLGELDNTKIRLISVDEESSDNHAFELVQFEPLYLDPFCATFKGLANEPVEQCASHALKFVRLNETFNVSRNDIIDLPCIFQNLDGNEIVWKKGEKIICDANKFICGDYYKSVQEPFKYNIAKSREICGQKQPGEHLVIHDIKHEDAGEYYCEMKSTQQVLTKITLKVVDTEFTTKGQTFSVNEGDNVTLPCNIKDIGDVHYPIWWFNFDSEEILITNGYIHTQPKEPRVRLVEGKNELLRKGIGYNLQINNITRELAGNYSCVMLMKYPPELITHKVIVKT